MNKLNKLLQSAVADMEKKSWEPEESERYVVVLTYSHGGAYFCFRLDSAAQSRSYPHGITEERIKEILDSLPKRLRPTADGMRRGWTATVRKNTTISQRLK